MLGALLGGALSLGSSLLGSSAAKSAARAQGEAVQRGVTAVDHATQQGQEYLAPSRQLGTQAIGNLSDMLSPGYDYTMSPDYQFAFDEGQRAIDSSGAARGMSMSGGTLKDLARFGSGTAMQGIGDTFGRNYQAAGLGQQGAIASGQFGMQGAQSLADLYTQGGNAKAAGIAGSAGAWQKGIGDIASLVGGKGVSKALNGIF